MKRMMVGCAVALMCGAGAAGAQEEITPQVAGEIVAARQAAFAMSAATFGAIKAGLDSGRPIDSLAFSAGGLNRWSASMTYLFPPGTGADVVAATKAKPEIWSDWTGFQAKAADYQAATARLKAAVTAGDVAAANEAWLATRATCGSCHDAYRS